VGERGLEVVAGRIVIRQRGYKEAVPTSGGRTGPQPGTRGPGTSRQSPRSRRRRSLTLDHHVCRFTQQRPTSEIARIFDAEDLAADSRQRYNVAPTDERSWSSSARTAGPSSGTGGAWSGLGR